MNSESKNTSALQKIRQSLDLPWSAEQLSIIKASVAQGTTDTQFAYFMSVAQRCNLDPFRKQIWCYKDAQGNLIIFAGRDGFLAHAQRQADFKGIRSAAVYESDQFSADVPNGVIDHKITSLKKSDRGEIVGAYCIIYRAEKNDTLVVVDYETYKRNSPTWRSHAEAMITKVAEVHALKKAYGLELQSEHEFETISQGDQVIVSPIDHEKPENDLDTVLDELTEAFDIYQGEDKEELRELVQEKIAAGEMTIHIAHRMIAELRGEDIAQPASSPDLFTQSD